MEMNHKRKMLTIFFNIGKNLGVHVVGAGKVLYAVKLCILKSYRKL